MIILRDKIFTFADRRVLEELKKVTDNFAHSPSTKGMHARDVFRLKNLTQEISTGVTNKSKPKINQKNLEDLANHLGLSETAKNGKHLIQKYYNPELADRYNRIILHNRYGLDDTDIKKLKLRRRILDNRAFETTNGFLEANKPKGIIDKIKYKYNNIKNQLKKNKRTVKNIHKINSVPYHMGYFASKPSKGKYDIYDFNQTPEEKNFRKIFDKLSKNENDSVIKTFTPPSIDENDKKLYKKLESDVKKKIKIKYNTKGKTEVRVSYKNGKVVPKNIDISLPKKQPADLAHEYGHIEYNKILEKNPSNSKLYDKNVMNNYSDYKINNSLNDLHNELGASTKGLAKLKKLGATPKQLEKNKKRLTDYYNTYWNEAMKNIYEDVHNRFSPINYYKLTTK